MKRIIIAVIAACATFAAIAHSGGTDKKGCHVDHKTGTYHCH